MLTNVWYPVRTSEAPRRTVWSVYGHSGPAEGRKFLLYIHSGGGSLHAQVAQRWSLIGLRASATLRRRDLLKYIAPAQRDPQPSGTLLFLHLTIVATVAHSPDRRAPSSS
jgi:hypothetical protein